MSMNADSERGRRRRVAKDGQALPLFMSAGRSRVSERVGMSAATSREMQRYLKWASEVTGLSWDEAQVMMLERALLDYFKKDEAWQAQKSSGAAGDTDHREGGSPPGTGGRAHAGKAGAASAPTRSGDAPMAPEPGRPVYETGSEKGK
jgi:hypothetical protein